MLADAMYAYLQEMEECRVICERHEKTSAIHTRGQSLQIYRQFKRDEFTARQIRTTTEDLPSWEQSIYWVKDGFLAKAWKKMQNEVELRMAKHSKLHPIITRGIAWEGRPILVHAYKFEPDPVMKVELVMGMYESPVPELPLQVIASLLRCHQFIVPDYIAPPLSPWDHHETKFSTIWEHLSRTMSPGLYATQCLPSSISPLIP